MPKVYIYKHISRLLFCYDLSPYQLMVYSNKSNWSVVKSPNHPLGCLGRKSLVLQIGLT